MELLPFLVALSSRATTQKAKKKMKEEEERHSRVVCMQISVVKPLKKKTSQEKEEGVIGDAAKFSARSSSSCPTRSKGSWGISHRREDDDSPHLVQTNVDKTSASPPSPEVEGGPG